MISVIIVTYNQERTIGRAIDSVLMQQCEEEVEILVADDASQDNTPEICRQYAERHPDKIRLFLNKTNKGIVDNYFDTLLACRGDLIADCAGDDQWCDPLKLEKERLIMREQEDVTLVHTAWKYRDEVTGKLSDSPALPFTNAITYGRDMLEAIITQTNVPVVHLCTSLYRKSIFLKAYENYRNLFRNKEYACEDLQLTFAMALYGKIAFLPDVTLHYSISTGTISNTGNEEKQFRFVRSSTQLSHDLSTIFDIHTDVTEQYFSQRVFGLLMHAFRSQSSALRSEAIECQRKWNVKEDKKIRLVKLATSNTVLWTITKMTRDLAVSVKRLLK